MSSTINIPTWLAENPELSWNAKALYSIYYYFTFFADFHCCLLTNDEVGFRLGLKERTIQREKQKLRDAGYIKFSGIRVYALMTEEMATTGRGDTNGSGGDINCTGSTKSDTHNKENKEKEESYNKGTYTEGDEVDDTGGSIQERNGARSTSWEAELREDLKQYVPDGYQRGDVISLVRQLGMERSSVWDILVRCYDWDVLPLQPLLKYYEEHPQDEVSMSIYQVLKDRDLDEYTQFCTRIDTNGKGQQKATPTE